MGVPVQELIHRFETGASQRILKYVVGVIAVIAIALFYDMAAYRNFSSPEAMDTAQLARNLADGEGFKTDFIRPFSLYLQRRAGRESGSGTNSSAGALELRADLSNPPAYPLVLAGVLKMMPFDYPDHSKARSFSTHSPEIWITGFNQLLMLISACLVFCIGRQLFDEPVGWVSAAAFVGAESFWRASVSGLSTIWLTTVLLAMAYVLVRIDTAARDPEPRVPRLVVWAALAGLLAAVAGLTRYGLLLLIVPLIIYVISLPVASRATLAAIAAAAFLALTLPWVIRNYSLSHSLFGTAAYAAFQDTTQFPGETLYRSSSADIGVVGTDEIIQKTLSNLRTIISQELPRLGGSWVTAFFLTGLLVPFRNLVTGRLRLFIVSALALVALVQASVGRPVSALDEATRSTDYLIVLAPLVFLFGVGLLFTLVVQFSGLVARYTVLALFITAACLPLLLTFARPVASPIAYPPYYPPWIQSKASWITNEEWMMSDMPWAIAWYGDRPSVWLSSKHGDPGARTSNDFYALHRLQPIAALHLSAQSLKTIDIASLARWREADVADADWERFREKMKAVSVEATSSSTNQAVIERLVEAFELAEKHWVRGGGLDWDSFVIGVFINREVPTGFPLQVAPEGLTAEIFLTDSERSAKKTIKVSEQAQP